MPTIDFDNVEPLIATTQTSGNTVSVVFRCPVTAETFQASAEAETGFWRRAGRTAKQATMWGVKSAISNRIYQSVSGHGTASYVAGSVGSQLVYGTQLPGESYKERPSNKKVREAIVEAFRTVSDQFAWEDGGRRWVSNNAAHVGASEFDKQLQAFPVTDAYDREMLGRVLAVVAAGDGHIDEQERQLFAAMLPGAPSLDQLAREPAPDAIKLGEVSAEGVRETIVMLAWAVAVSDENLEQSEISLIEGLTGVMRIAPERGRELRMAAQAQVLDMAITHLFSGGKSSTEVRTEIEPIARGISFDTDEAQRMVVRAQRRLGIAW